jgi:glyoxylate reductase
MRVLYFGPRRKQEAEQSLQASFVPNLEALLSQSDFVSLNCPLTDESRHLIGCESLRCFKPNATLVNTGRGLLIDENALIDALKNGTLGAAGLDVFEFEPKVSAGLLDFDNVTLLPHIGSATGECRLDMAQRGIANVRAFLADGAPLDLVEG